MSAVLALTSHARSSIFEPMLATTAAKISKLKYPIYASAKLDGVRCLIFAGEPLSQMMTPIINDHVRKSLNGLPALDGEITIGSATEGDVWGRAMSGLMRREGEPDFTYWVFDTFAEPIAAAPFEERLAAIERQVAELQLPFVKVASHTLCQTSSQVVMLERTAVGRGFDGLILRSPSEPYQFGTVGMREHMIKLKRWELAYGTLIDVIEEVQRDGIRSQPMGRAEAIVVAFRHQSFETMLTIKHGIEHRERIRLWVEREHLIGRTVRFRHQRHNEGAHRMNVYVGLVE
jgi:DNA ligase-1